MPSNDRQKIARGERTKLFWENDEVQVAVQELIDEIYLEWGGTKSDEKEKREELYRDLRGIRHLSTKIERVIAVGRRTEDELARERNNGK